jgi:hypothetical protein
MRLAALSVATLTVVCNSPPVLLAAVDANGNETAEVASEITANWTADSGEQWTVPLVFSVSQVMKIGRQPVSFQIGAKYYAESPSDGPDWGVRLAFTLLYPTAKPKPAAVPGADSK